ncbi:MAG: tRNA (adenosine(37)-N6)-dimethylallyltransferase MiaA [Desulforhopalus sp.]|nr:tRNA (adenosine(37)-N6)-dimethylallyltransferase MiaA [Desulforhopalus sp.]
MLILVGPTAIGKTDLSLQIARRFPCEIISVDSMQVYRYLDIGTAKASSAERDEVVHHLIDIVDPDEAYDAARFAVDARKVLEAIAGRGKIALLTGGSGLYLRALLEPFFPGVPVDDDLRNRLKKPLFEEGNSKLHKELSLCDRVSAERIHPNDSHRLLRALEIYSASGIPWSEHLRRQRSSSDQRFLKNTLMLGLTCERQVLYQRIDQRCRLMLDNGLEAEVSSLLGMGYGSDLKPMQAIGYRHMLEYIAGRWGWDDMVRLLARDTRRYAKRQYTWFSAMTDIQWFEKDDPDNVLRLIAGWLR